ncbi:TPA: contractile injection system protein, VgrG/Pvc8 family, partial [Escherichia coli]
TEWSPLFSEPHPSREFCVQYGETDYDFLCRMAAEEGIFFYEEHAYKSTDQSLVLCDTVRHLPESFEIPWNPNTRTEVSTLCISQFRYSAQIRPSSVVTKDYTFKRPGWAGRFEQEGQHQDYITPDPIGLRGGWNMYQYPLNPIQVIDPMGLDAIENMTSGGLIYAVSGVPGLIAANSITNSAYQFGYDMDAIVGGAHNGAADAMRHCYLMCRMTKTFGSTIADVIGKNHEAAGDRQGQPAKERIMDLKNNTVGIACGDFSAKCSDACIEKYNTGQLFGLDGIKADNPIKAKQGSSDASNY